MIWFLGDVHGRFDHVIRLVKLHRPEAVVFLGDLECSLPLDMILRPILEQTEIWFIHGNHDSDRIAGVLGNHPVQDRKPPQEPVLHYETSSAAGVEGVPAEYTATSLALFTTAQKQGGQGQADQQN